MSTSQSCGLDFLSSPVLPVFMGLANDAAGAVSREERENLRSRHLSNPGHALYQRVTLSTLAAWLSKSVLMEGPLATYTFKEN